MRRTLERLVVGRRPQSLEAAREAWKPKARKLGCWKLPPGDRSTNAVEAKSAAVPAALFRRRFRPKPVVYQDVKVAPLTGPGGGSTWAWPGACLRGDR